jgi:hypothetical protein
MADGCRLHDLLLLNPTPRRLPPPATQPHNPPTNRSADHKSAEQTFHPQHPQTNHTCYPTPVRIINQTTETAPIDTVRPHPRNPRQGDIGSIHTSITANGFYGTVIAQRSTGHILAGNHRWQAARQAGATTIPVTWIDVQDDHALRILLADNRTNDLATYNDQALSELLQELHATTGTLTGTGYDNEDLDDLINLVNGPPDLADMTDPIPTDDDRIILKLKAGTANRWRNHRSLHDTDDAALTDLLP